VSSQVGRDSSTGSERSSAEAAGLDVLVSTGAGVSADSGLATFRGAGGLWEEHRIEDVATPEAWRRDPVRVWRFYQLRRAALREVLPNPAHAALAGLERRVRAAGGRFTLVTQNVDDLHERAGSADPVHVHGELAVLACEACGSRERDLVRIDPDAFVPCARCGHARLRPGVVWFGEVPYRLDEAFARAQRCTHFLSVGSSGVVYPAAGLLDVAREGGARIWVASLEPPDNLAGGDEYVAGRAREVVPALCERLAAEWGLRGPGPSGRAG